MKNLFYICALAVALSGCAPGSLQHSSVEREERYRSFTFGKIYGRYAVKVKQSVNELMARDFTAGDDGLVVNLNVVSADEGSRLDRWMLGPLAGGDSQGKIVVKAEFQNSKGERVGEATVTGKIVVGIFGGSFDTAIKSAAKQIHAFAVRRFKE